jgi:transcriptional regulator with XRE-family HTH domain
MSREKMKNPQLFVDFVEDYVSRSGMPRKRKLDHDPGPLAQTMLAARHKAGLSAVTCAELCGLSTSFLHHIEAGARCPELERVPAIARAYGIPPVELIWTWLLAYAPSTVPILASYDTVMDTPFLQQHFEVCREEEATRLLAQKAERAANKIATPAQAAQVARLFAERQPVAPGPAPEASGEPDFAHVAIRQTGELDPARSPATPAGGTAGAPGPVKRQ